MNKQLVKSGITRLWLLQLSLILVISAVSFIKFSGDMAWSVLLGGMVCFIPNAYFAIKLFKYQGARAARNILNNFYAGEALKICMTALLFTLVFMVFKVKPLAFFVSYIMVQMTHWLAPWIIVFKQNRPESD